MLQYQGPINTSKTLLETRKIIIILHMNYAAPCEESTDKT